MAIGILSLAAVLAPVVGAQTSSQRRIGLRRRGPKSCWTKQQGASSRTVGARRGSSQGKSQTSTQRMRGHGSCWPLHRSGMGSARRLLPLSGKPASCTSSIARGCEDWRRSWTRHSRLVLRPRSASRRARNFSAGDSMTWRLNASRRPSMRLARAAATLPVRRPGSDSSDAGPSARSSCRTGAPAGEMPPRCSRRTPTMRERCCSGRLPTRRWRSLPLRSTMPGSCSRSTPRVLWRTGLCTIASRPCGSERSGFLPVARGRPRRWIRGARRRCV
mmetsp:Transcript_112656/g.313342  ORF Transcript_112656/g.313342 Transcript_112656/m.313342 type:complete len:274 (-) Transcript_112656:47-868(-)